MPNFNGDLVFVTQGFLGPDKITIFDVYLRNKKAFVIRDGHLILPAPAEPSGEVDMGSILLLAVPSADIVGALPVSFWQGKEIAIIPAS